MANGLPNNLYTGGAVTFNTQPQVQFYAQLLARRQAKYDALDEYYRRLPSTINDAGMRDQERPILNQKLNDAQEYWLKNKDKVHKIGAEQYELEKKYRDIHQLINDSKERAKTGLELGKMKFQPNSQYIFDDPDIMDKIHKHDLPIGSEGSEGIDLATMTVPPKPFGAKEQAEALKASIGEYKPSKVFDESNTRRDKTSGQVFVPYQQTFKPDQIKAIADKYGELASESKSMQNHYWKSLHDPKTYHDLNEAYQSVYGANDFVNTPVKAAKASAILNAKVPTGTGEEMRADSQLAFDRQKQLQAIRQANAKDLIDKRHQLTKDDKTLDDLWVGEYLDKLETDAKWGQATLLDGADSQVYEIPLDPEMLKALNRGGGGQNAYTPEKLFVSQNGTYYPIYKSDGKFDKASSTPLSQQQMRLALGNKTVTKAKLGKEVKGTTKPKEKLHW